MLPEISIIVQLVSRQIYIYVYPRTEIFQFKISRDKIFIQILLYNLSCSSRLVLFFYVIWLVISLCPLFCGPNIRTNIQVNYAKILTT